ELKRTEAEARSYASSLELLNQALATSQATREKASEMKSEYLVQLSAKVNQNLSTILDTIESSGQADGLEEILDSSRHLMSALDRILDLAQLETGDLVFDPQPCNIIELTRETVEGRRPGAEAKGLELVLDLPGALPDSVECDAVRYRQALDILLENSIQHTDRGSVLVEMRMEPTADWQRSRLKLRIRDSGPGVPSELEGRLYEPFASHGPHAGTGLGLALTRQLARCMGGDVTHEDAPERGSIFTLSMQVGTVSGARMVGG
ncbi:MAG: HAMP domain-containing sensor histidine kinase, partial [Planctomycetota bacterium]